MKGHLFFLLLVSLVTHAETAPAKVAVIAAPSLHVPSVQRVTKALHHAATEFDVDAAAIPNIVLVCADRRTADVMMLARNVDLSIDTLMDANRPVYRVTIVGDADNRALAVAMVWFINTHFHLGWSTPRLMKLAGHIRDDLEQTVEVSELAERK